MKSDLRDFGVLGQDPAVINRIGDERAYLISVTNWKSKSLSKKGTPLSLHLYPGKRVIQMPNGDIKVIKWTKKKGAHFVDFDKYKTSLIKDARIPSQLITKIKNLEGQMTLQGLGVSTVQPGASKGFAEWFAKDIMGKQRTERDFWNRLGALYQEYGFEPNTWYGSSSVGRDYSHFKPKSRGGRFTFIEHWLANRSRGAKTFIGDEALKQAQIPTTYEELFDHYQNIVLGGKKPWYGSLNNLNLDDINALARGDGVPEVVLRRQSINQILTEAMDIREADPGSERLLQLNEEYKRLIQTSRGKDYLTADSRNINLEADINTAIKHRNKGTSVSSGYEVVEGIYEPPEGTLVKGYDVDVDQGGPKANIKGKHVLSGGLTIGGLTNATKGLASEVGWSGLNEKTGYNLGVLASGEGDSSNVQGAVQGVGEDLLGGGLVSGGMKAGQLGWKKALQLAGKKGATHFAGKSMLGKAIPYVGWGLLAYGAYDTADAFTEGLTGKGITERASDMYNRVINEEFAPDRKWSERHSNQDLNFTTM
tara:strand:+ start:225 stop:1832 length:1608 start_codon:yes stop_codon:yes gene_type:complete